MTAAILTYHAMRIHGNDYATSDLVALAADLHAITASGLRIVPLHDVVGRWLRSPEEVDREPVVALTCDDGSDFDAVDLPHPSWGLQRSVLGILSDYRSRHGARQPGLHITSFVIASPDAREELDRTCMVGRGWWNEHWWGGALASGLLAIGNHSWDHNHESLARPCGGMTRGGSFTSIDSPAAADYEIRQADEYLRARAPNPGARLFAYPYGETNPYLSDEYFPAYRGSSPAPAAMEPGFAAAFTTEPEHLSSRADRWRMPRFMCARDWKSPEDLLRILEGAGRPPG